MNKTTRLMILFNITAVILMIVILIYSFLLKATNNHITVDQLSNYIKIEQHNLVTLNKLEADMVELQNSMRIVIEDKYKPLTRE